MAEIAFLVLLFAFGFLVRLWPMWKVHFWDEAVYLQNAEYICCGKHNYSELSFRPPLLSLLYAGVFLLWNSAYAASLVSAALNAVGPLCLYYAARRLYGRPAAVLGALLLAFSPYFVNLGNTLLSDLPALSLTLLAFCVLLEAVATDGRGRLALAGFLSGLSGLMRFTSLITLFIFPLYFVRKGNPLRRAVWFASGLSLSFGPYLMWSRVQYGSFLGTLHLATANVGGTRTPKLYYIRNIIEIFGPASVVGVLLWFVAWALDSLAARNGEGEEFMTRLRKRFTAPSPAGDAILWAWAFLVLAYFSNTAHPVGELRYIIPLAAPLFLLAGRGLAVLTRARTVRSRAVGIGLLALVFAYTFAPLRHRFTVPFISGYVSEEKNIADYLNDHANQAGVLYTNFNYPVFGYYTRMKVSQLWPEDANFYGKFPDNMPRDGYLLIYKDVPKQPTVAWAEDDPHFRRMKEFPSLVIYEYRRAGFP